MAACGDDADDTENGKDSGAVTRGDAGGDAGGDSGLGNVGCNPAGSGACQNEDDCPIVEGGTARTAAQMCGRNCLGMPDEASCARACVVQATMLSGDCADCYVGIVRCTINNCIGECVADSNSAGCFQCQVDKGCRSTFDSCSGLPPAP